MRRLLTALLLVSPGLAGELGTSQIPKSKYQASALLPPGSELKDVIFPNYNEHHRLVSVLKAKTMTLVSPQQISAEAVSVKFCNPDQSQRGHIDLAHALLDQDQGLLRSDQPLEIQYDQMTSHGTGLRYFIQQHQGFLLGPVTTHILQAPPKTTMKSSPSKLTATAAISMTILAQPLTAAPPAPMTAQERAAIEADATPKAPVVAEGVADAKASLAADLAASKQATEATAKLLDQAHLPASSATTFSPDTHPLEKEPGATDTVIHCDGGFYFDADQGVFVYLKNVTVKDPRFTLTGANELKIFLGKKPPEPKDAKTQKDTKTAKPSKEDSISAGFDGVERIVATGAIRVVIEASEGHEQIEASAAIFTYNAKAEQIILTGGYPWVIQGKQYQRAKQPDLSLRIFLNPYSVVTEGVWETVLDLKQKP